MRIRTGQSRSVLSGQIPIGANLKRLPGSKVAVGIGIGVAIGFATIVSILYFPSYITTSSKFCQHCNNSFKEHFCIGVPCR
jgi:hypothetical protein